MEISELKIGTKYVGYKNNKDWIIVVLDIFIKEEYSYIKWKRLSPFHKKKNKSWKYEEDFGHKFIRNYPDLKEVKNDEKK